MHWQFFWKQTVKNQNCIQTRCQEFKAANSCLDAAIFYCTLMHQENTVFKPFFAPALPCNNNIYLSIRQTMMKCSVIILPSDNNSTKVIFRVNILFFSDSQAVLKNTSKWKNASFAKRFTHIWWVFNMCVQNMQRVDSPSVNTLVM